MAKRVNSLSELLQTGPSESQIFEGLDEIVPSSVLDSFEASTPTVPPHPEPQPEPQAPIQAVDPAVEPEAGPSQRRIPRSAPRGAPRRRYSRARTNALEAFIAVNPRPTREQKAALSEQIGLTVKKISQWIQRYWNRGDDIQSVHTENIALKKRVEELVKENEELQVKNQFLNDILNSSACPQCRGPVLHPDVQQSGKEVVPPQPELLLDPIDSLFNIDFMPEDLENLISTTVDQPSSHVPSEILPGPAHDLVGVSTEDVDDIVRKARDELILMATANYPLWISSPNPSISIHTEILNFEEYLRMSRRGKPAPYFQSEASRDTATIPLDPTTIVQLLMDVDQWLPVFCSMLTNVQTLEVLSSGIEGSYREQKQVMSAEFLVASHRVSTREVQFVRYSHQQLDGSWIVVDVSVDELRSIPRPAVRSICRKRPSGCLIRDLQNGSSLVTWVENVDVREKDLGPIFIPFVVSGFAFGAKRWISTLQRQAQRFICCMVIDASPNDTIIIPEGRRSLAKMANKMVVSFCNDISNSSYHHWTKSNTTRDTHMEVRTNKRRGDPSKPPGVNRTAGCTIEFTSPHTIVFDFLRDVQTRPLWDSMSIGSSVNVLANVTTGLDPRNCISVLSISNHNGFLLLQECCTDATGSYVIYTPIDAATFQSILCGADPEPIPIMSSGFSILPNVSGDVLNGTLLTIVFQVSVTVMSSKKSVDLATIVVQETLQRIRAAVN